MASQRPSLAAEFFEFLSIGTAMVLLFPIVYLGFVFIVLWTLSGPLFICGTWLESSRSTAVVLTLSWIAVIACDALSVRWCRKRGASRDNGVYICR